MMDVVGNVVGIIWGMVFLIIFLISAFWSNKSVRFSLLFLIFFLFGCLRMLLAELDNNPKQIQSYLGIKKDLVGYVVDYPMNSQNNMKYYFQSENFDGKILITTGLYPKYHYGDRLKISCILNIPENFSSRFRYDKYLARYGVLAICNQPKIMRLVGQDGSWGRRLIANWRQYLQVQIEHLWPAPESALMSGLLYGDSSALPNDIKEDFSRAGISHIVAVSGYNTSIIVLAVMTILIFVGLFRRQAFWMANLQLVLFVIFTGASASVVRAAIMAGVLLSAERIGRMGNMLNVLVMTACIMILINPYILVWDVGFQLSFLSTVGIVYFHPIISPRLSFLPEWLGEILSATLSAICLTAPLTIYQFGQFSLVAPLSNILVLWLIPVLMFLGLGVLVLNIFSFALAQIFAWLTYIGLHYIIFVAKIMAGWHGAVRELTIPTWLMFLVYILIIVYLVKKKYNSSINFD